MFDIGLPELLVILALAAILFGGKRLPEIGYSLGKAISGFKKALAETTDIEPLPAATTTCKECKKPIPAASSVCPSCNMKLA